MRNLGEWEWKPLVNHRKNCLPIPENLLIHFFYDKNHLLSDSLVQKALLGRPPLFTGVLSKVDD